MQPRLVLPLALRMVVFSFVSHGKQLGENEASIIAARQLPLEAWQEQSFTRLFKVCFLIIKLKEALIQERNKFLNRDELAFGNALAKFIFSSVLNDFMVIFNYLTMHILHASLSLSLSTSLSLPPYFLSASIYQIETNPTKIYI